MDTFSKIRKSAGREEQKRQMINKAIDLLHKLANKRLDYDEAKSEISRVVSEYYVIDDEDGMGDNAKINLEVMINNSFDVLEGIKDEKLNLYQAIMLMNKVMAHQEPVKVKPKVEIQTAPIQEVVKMDVVVEETKKVEKSAPLTPVKSEDLLKDALNQVIENKKRLQQSIEDLNEVLKGHGFTLSLLEPK